eukprot:CAMPEP_0202978904 /NCGR_PEP_ID=MMETSP1396-20130829/85196_1 /ASSEMBLY_ACC=CAM_ASM_000872 /TAXON_ID= /ORGANISM="Pseudokeronopsis sp., Strain Brazil" /LENGTH=52 /DNA_ID=CAMNT_0049718077 /DNA_START=1765 /DNA_END=1923 /DNA_ORIENTATION=-
MLNQVGKGEEVDRNMIKSELGKLEKSDYFEDEGQSTEQENNSDSQEEEDEDP